MFANGRSWIPILFTILLQTAGVIWWARGLSAKVDELQKETDRQAIIISQNAVELNMVKTIQQEFIKHNRPYEHPEQP